jgi:pyrroloquinoline quinone (PQQ) biosynthesis protein C
MMTRDDSTFLEELQYEVQSHPVVRHPFLQRFAEGGLSLEQLRAYATQHYLYSRRFSQNLAALIANTPDEHARMLLILNMYEEIGEPARIRDRVHFLLLEHGLVTGVELGQAMEEHATGGSNDVVSRLIEKRIVTRGQVSSLMELNTKRARDFTHPALFRRFLSALGLGSDALLKATPTAETQAFSESYEHVCRNAHWLEGMGTMGPGTECVVAPIYSQILDGLKRSAGVSEGDCVFWTIHVHCDDGHGANFIEAVRPYMGDGSHRDLTRKGAMSALDARERWLDGMYRHVFAAESAPARRVSRPSFSRPEQSPEQKARAFSERGDQVFRALASRFPNARTWRLLIEQPLPAPRFDAIRSAMLEYVSQVLESPFSLSEPDALKLLLQERNKIANFTSGGMLAPKREHTRSFNALHAAVAAAFADFGMHAHVDGIDLPINVRMVYGDADQTRKAAPFSSSKRHADVWAGVPADAVVVVLPVLGDIDNLTIECAEMPAERELSAMYGMRDYDEGAGIPVVRSYDACKMKHGHVYLADVRLLHQTVRRVASGVRLSVDFRFRSNDRDYRALTPPLVSSGPDSIDTRIPYAEWLDIGKERLIEFDETMTEARANKSQASSAPVNLAKYRMVPRAEEP